jgi:hypothetical protein
VTTIVFGVLVFVAVPDNVLVIMSDTKALYTYVLVLEPVPVTYERPRINAEPINVAEYVVEFVDTIFAA